MAEKEGGVGRIVLASEEEGHESYGEERRRESVQLAEIPGPVLRASPQSWVLGETEREKGERLARRMPTGGNRAKRKSVVEQEEGQGWVFHH